jgi:EAL domain-containing protein (putative c-di-GMP-specific phosphodiesterase class I)
MRHNEWPRIAGVASFSLLAVGCAAFLIGTGDLHQSVIGAGLLLLAAGQLFMLTAGWLRLSRLAERQREQGRAVRDLSDSAAAVVDRLQALESKPATPAPAPRSDSTIAEMQVLRQQLQDLLVGIQSPAAAPAPRQAAAAPSKPAAAAAAPPKPVAAATAQPDAAAAARPSPAAASERLDLLLEPVIELLTGETSHYRALLAMVDGGGHEVAHADLMRKAEQNGVRPQLDVHLLRQALPVFRRLRMKHPAMRLFVPVGAPTLNTPAEIDRLQAALEAASDIAPGVVLDLSHSALGALSDSGVDGLARLGRLGTTMVLSQVALNGLDLLSLRKLGVRFLDIDARSFEQGFGVAPAWSDFVQYARSMQFSLIGGCVETAAQSLAASRLARYGYGPYFAPARRVRPDAGEAPAASGSSQVA